MKRRDIVLYTLMLVLGTTYLITFIILAGRPEFCDLLSPVNCTGWGVSAIIFAIIMLGVSVLDIITKMYSETCSAHVNALKTIVEFVYPITHVGLFLLAVPLFGEMAYKWSEKTYTVQGVCITIAIWMILQSFLLYATIFACYRLRQKRYRANAGH